MSIPVTTPSLTLKPIRELKLSMRGGIAARRGFTYQDHIAARFVLLMLAQPKLKEVWCETYDGVLLIWVQDCGVELIEYVQVKNENLDRLYTPTVLMSRDNLPRRIAARGSFRKSRTSPPGRRAVRG